MTTLEERIIIIKREKISDPRGYFLKVLTGKEDGLPLYTGEIYLTSARPKQTRGGHYHIEGNEWFTLLQGECELKLQDILTGETLTINLSEKEPITIYVPAKVAHLFVNTSDVNDFFLLAYTDQLYSPKDVISYNLV